MSKAWLYNQENFSGKLFELGDEHKKGDEYKKLKADGWLDNPSTLDKPEEEAPEIDEARVASMTPDALADQVKAFGYHVFTDIELKVRISKALSEASDKALCDEVDKRGLVKSDSSDDINELQDKFADDPKSLTKEEHLALGRALGVKLRINFGEDTMIEKIQAKLEEA